MRFLARRMVLGLADHAATMPLVRWIWTGPSNEDIVAGVTEFLPTDRESVVEMVAGRYLLASKLIDTHGASPFSVPVEHADWLEDLQTFGWLRHFRDARTDEERSLARELTLDWIRRYGVFDRKTWSLALCSRRVLNWLKHYNLIVEGATIEEVTQIGRALGTQIQSLRLRGPLAVDPVDALFAAIALSGVALCEEKRYNEIPTRVRRVNRLLSRQIDRDGLHRTRSAKVQAQLLIELTSLKQALRRYHEQYAEEFDDVIERMHRALDGVSMSTGQPGYFNGTGQLPHDMLVAIQSQSISRMRETGTIDGYGRIVAGTSVVVADSGTVPPPEYAQNAHSGALSFEFSRGSDLIVGNCGPAPAGDQNPGYFREGLAHSAPTINSISANPIRTSGALAGRLVQHGDAAQILADEEDDAVVMRTHGYADRFGVVIERRLTLIAEGKSLVGQDKFFAVANKVTGTCAIRFHLAGTSEVEEGPDLVRIRTASGQWWSFLWDGAHLHIEDSMRQSAFFGFHKTRQLVLTARVGEVNEVSWIFTLEEK